MVYELKIKKKNLFLPETTELQKHSLVQYNNVPSSGLQPFPM